MSTFQPVELLRRLFEHNVDFIVIGGIAATLHGSPLRTNDTDICPNRTIKNAQRLSAALTSLEAKLRTEASPLGVAFPHDAHFLLEQDLWTLVTVFGNFDIAWKPAGTDGYSDLIRASVRYDVGNGCSVGVADLADVIRSKEAAGREKDLAALPTLKRLLERPSED